MKYELIIRKLAELDFFEAQDWYNGQRPGLGDEFRATASQLLLRVQENPYLYPEVHRGVRRAVMNRFPYLLYYSISSELIIVHACLHSMRHPDLFKDRLS